MRFQRLHLDDFGCFRNARLDDLHPNLVVIGGPQRAGKTTLLTAMRQFPGGIDRDDALPPATDRYRIDATVALEDHRYRYRLEGHAAPSVTPIDGAPERTAADLFGAVSETQFRNLYTLSLDELRKLPPGIDDSEDLARVLLGGAYGDIATIPEVAETFDDRADEIGLSRGDPTTSTSALHEPYERLTDGIAAREEATAQVAEHARVSDQLAEARERRDDLDATLADLDLERTRLNILSELTAPMATLRETETRLADGDLAAIEAFPDRQREHLEHLNATFDDATEELDTATDAFERERRIADTPDDRAWLLDNADAIEALSEARQAWAQTADRLGRQDEELTEQRSELEETIATLHPDWSGRFAEIEGIEISAIDEARLTQTVETVDRLESERESLESSIERAEARIADLEAELADMNEVPEPGELSVPKRKPAGVGVVAIAVGAIVGLWSSPIVGGLAGTIVLFGGLAVIDLSVDAEPALEPVRELKGRVTSLETDLEGDRERLATVEARLADHRADLATISAELGLPSEGMAPGDVEAFYREVRSVAGRIRRYRNNRSRWETELSDLRGNLEAANDLLATVADTGWDPDAPLATSQGVLRAIENAAADLEAARSISAARDRREQVIAEIDEIVREWNPDRSVSPGMADREVRATIEVFLERAEDVERMRSLRTDRDAALDRIESRFEASAAREAFAPRREGDEPWSAVVLRVAEEYPDATAIERAQEAVADRIDACEAEREELRERCRELEAKREELASPADLREAQQQIDAASVAFERLGEEYAVNRIAETMTERLHTELLESIVDSLMDEASAVFSRLTGTYEGIDIEGDLETVTFRARRADGPDHGIGELSRATAEQLFLAVRVAKIRRTSPSLPVVLDDATTNFDPAHAGRVFDVLGELGADHQVFFLTCHPNFVEIPARRGMAAQYWALEDGKFTETVDADALAGQLAAEDAPG